MKRLFPLLTAAALIAPAASALAQVPVGKTTSKAPILTKEELRACMKREVAVNEQRTTAENRKAVLDAERAEVTKLSEGLQPLKADVEAKAGAIKQLNERTRVLGERIVAFNAKAANPPADDAGRKALQDEEKQLKTEAGAIEAEGKPLQAAYEAAVAALNDKAKVHDERAAAWNEKQSQVVAAAREAEQARQGWMLDCADRRYREDDEKAIKAGK